jgi:hypothetical protein
MRKVRGKSCYSVRNKKTRRITARCTTRELAQKQMRLLYGLENGMETRIPLRRRPLRGRRTRRRA